MKHILMGINNKIFEYLKNELKESFKDSEVTNLNKTSKSEWMFRKYKEKLISCMFNK